MPSMKRDLNLNAQPNPNYTIQPLRIRQGASLSLPRSTFDDMR